MHERILISKLSVANLLRADVDCSSKETHILLGKIPQEKTLTDNEAVSAHTFADKKFRKA